MITFKGKIAGVVTVANSSVEINVEGDVMETGKFIVSPNIQSSSSSSSSTVTDDSKVDYLKTRVDELEAALAKARDGLATRVKTLEEVDLKQMIEDQLEDLDYSLPEESTDALIEKVKEACKGDIDALTSELGEFQERTTEQLRGLGHNISNVQKDVDKKFEKVEGLFTSMNAKMDEILAKK